MHRARQHSETRIRERRHRVACEAARLMAEGGHRDVHQARSKAAARLGIDDDASQPRAQEIEAALREYQRLFLGTGLDAVLAAYRRAALEAMAFFEAFDPRLVGPVLTGTADRHTPVALHLHADDADAVSRFLHQAGIPADLGSARLRLDRTRDSVVPTWTFSADGVAFDVAVLPMASLRQAPRSPDGTPMPRASAAQLRRLLENVPPGIG